MAFKMKYQGFLGKLKRFFSDPTYKNKQRQIDMFNSDPRSNNPANAHLRTGGSGLPKKGKKY